VNFLQNPKYLQTLFYHSTEPLEIRKIAYEKWGIHPISLFDWISTHGFLPYPKKRFFEGGCGNGDFFSKWLKNPDIQEATAIDLSPAMIQKAKSINTRGNFLVGDLHNLPFADGSFDLSLSLCVFHHLENPERALSELKRVSKKGTVIIGWHEACLTVGIEKLHYQALKALNMTYSNPEENSMVCLYKNLKKTLEKENPHSIHQYINELHFPRIEDALRYYNSALIFRDNLLSHQLEQNHLSEIQKKMRELLKMNLQENFRKSVLHLYVYTA